MFENIDANAIKDGLGLALFLSFNVALVLMAVVPRHVDSERLREHPNAERLFRRTYWLPTSILTRTGRALARLRNAFLVFSLVIITTLICLRALQ